MPREIECGWMFRRRLGRWMGDRDTILILLDFTHICQSICLSVPALLLGSSQTRYQLFGGERAIIILYAHNGKIVGPTATLIPTEL